MSRNGLLLEVVVPDGTVVREAGVEFVVLHRREVRFEVGSEIAVFPRHAPMLVRLPAAPVRYRIGGETRYLAVAGGLAEVRRDRVRIVSPRVEPPAPLAPDPARAVAARCREWAAGGRATGEAMVGYREP